jgi:predicted transcriptional regulator
MKDKIIYWDYALWIMVFSIIFFNCVVYIGQFLEWIMPKFDLESKKNSFR